MTFHSQQMQSLTASIRESGSYPENLIHRTIYLDALKNYKTNLDEMETKLFVSKEDDVNVPFRDLVGDGPSNFILPR